MCNGTYSRPRVFGHGARFRFRPSPPAGLGGAAKQEKPRRLAMGLTPREARLPQAHRRGAAHLSVAQRMISGLNLYEVKTI